jgi:hypothetical protein
MGLNKISRKIYEFIFPRKQTKHPDAYCDISYSEPKIHFNSLQIVNKTPGNAAINENEFIAVIHENTPYWAMFRCPCGCGTVISLSLQKIHKPSWTVEKSKYGRPSLYPSVWQNKGCCSHFWIKGGRVHWCGNSGIEPWIADPEHYSRPITA